MRSWVAIGSPKGILAAVSGGADSMALLAALAAISREKGIDLLAVHVDHGIREESVQDGDFVSRYCRDFMVPCRVIHVKLKSNSENDAREARYQALYGIALEGGYPVIALAHHLRDQAETMLLHLFRGSGLQGLAGMDECRQEKRGLGAGIRLWRPFLEVPPHILREALKEKEISWREDATNAGDMYLRNYLRHRVLPAVEERFPAAQQAMGRAARILRDDEEYLQLMAMDFLNRYACAGDPCPFVLLQPLRKQHLALQRRILRAFFPVSLDYEQTERLIQLRPGEQVNLPAGWKAFNSGSRFHALPPNAPSPSIGEISVLPYLGDAGDGYRRQAIPRELLKRAELRFRRPGDTIHPLGGPGRKKIQDYWVDKKMDRPFRPYLPLLCIGERVLWSIGVGPGEEMRVHPGDEAVLLEYIGYLPGESPGNDE